MTTTVRQGRGGKPLVFQSDDDSVHFKASPGLFDRPTVSDKPENVSDTASVIAVCIYDYTE